MANLDADGINPYEIGELWDRGQQTEMSQADVEACLTFSDMNTFVPWTARIVRKGDTFGLNECLTHEADEPMVEFYDADHKHTRFGQFVARYNVRAILAQGNEVALDLHSSTPAWLLCGESMNTVRAWLRFTLGR